MDWANGCESWTIKKAESWRIDAFELWCWRTLLRVLCTARRSNQSILKEINLKYSLEGLMLNLKVNICCCSVSQSCPTLCDPMDCSTPGLPVLRHLLELAQTHVHWVSGAIQPSHPLSSPSPPAFNLSQHQGLFQWASSSYQVAKVLKLQLQHPFQWTFRTDFL